VLQENFADLDAIVTASNRAGMVYGSDSRALAERLDSNDAAELVLFLEGGEAVARREGEELRFAPDGDGWRTSGDAAIVDHADGPVRIWAALHDRNAGEVLVSAAPGVEFADLAGRHHAGGGSHGSLTVGDSEVPMLTIGVDRSPRSIVEIAPAIIEHFGLEPPAYQQMRQSLAV
jgi:hypothetical protein